MSQTEEIILAFLEVCYEATTDQIIRHVSAAYLDRNTPQPGAAETVDVIESLQKQGWLFHPLRANGQPVLRCWRRRTARQHAELAAEKRGEQGRLL